MPQLIQSEIKLTIGILVSNHKMYIRKAMEALVPLLKAVPSELIVIDTMGEKTDGSIEIVREYTDKIYRFEWCNDFSAARNFCLDHAKGEWFLYQDDDEWFDDVTELIAFFQSGEYKNYNAGHYYTRDYLPEGGYSVGIAGRMIRRAVNTRFEGRVHETFNEVYGPNKVFSCFTHHYGYMYADAKESEEKQKRNLTILQSEIEEEGITARRAAQLVLELIGSEATKEEGYQKTMEFIPKLKQMGELMDSCTQWLLVTSVRNFVGRDMYPQLIEQARFIRKSYPLTQTAELVLALVVFFAAIGEDDIVVAKEYGKLYLKQYDWRKAHEKESLSQVQLDFPNFLGENYYFSVIHRMAAICNRMQEFEEANQYWSRMPWNREDFDKSEYEADLQETMQGLKRKKEALEWRKKMGGKLVKSKIKLTIGMLVSNRIAYIRKTMESLKPLLTAIPSELIVVDTKGVKTDGSIAIVKEYTDKIYRFEWCDDFSAARNVCLDHAKGEWFLYIDDDEWFDDVTELIEFFQSGECETYNSGYYYTHDYEKDGTYSVGVAGRIIRRCKDTRFQGRVHETFNKVHGPHKVFSCFTHHYGYAFQTEEEAKRHQERNIAILKKEIMQKGSNSKVCAQMVQELMHLEQSSLVGLHFAIDCLQRLEQKNHVKDSCFQWIIASTVRYYARKNDLEGAKKQLAYVEKQYELSEMTKLVLAGTMANIASYKEAAREMYTYALEYLNYWDWKQEHEEEALIQINLDYPKFLEDRYYYQMVRVGAVGANRLKLYQEANTLWRRLPFGTEGFDAKPYNEELHLTIRGLQEEKDRQYEEKVVNLGALVEILMEVVQEVKKNFSLGQIDLVRTFLVSMQETAITLGTSLDKLIGEGSVTVKLLEQYCELLWNCSNARSVEEGLALVELLGEAITLIYETFLKETRKKQTILLFPSKAEDWSLFEPYWTNAKQNGDNVYVIPIPYFEKNYDGSFGKEYFENENFPNDVVITNYKQYEYHHKLADLIVVKDDYSETHPFYSVHPFYYVDNLKKYAKEVEVVSKFDDREKELNKQRKNIEEGEDSFHKEEISLKKEVVFCPYKASMWDSLESVWKAAKEDPTCDAYVVPIPYFDKLSDGSFGELHYEGGEYPKDVPITDYRDYNFEKRQPDMIFIHNPYDEYNYITSVHPYFYASNLKKYTKKLVYIPYFVLAEPRENMMATMTEEEKEKMVSFCIQPGVIKSDVVIVQSEAMKQLYVDLLSEHFGEKTRQKWEEKILGLGSPKMDKVASTSEENVEIPEAWNNILYKKDGTRRKIILYNTSVSALLKYEDAILEKMRNVFQTFYENREEIALLWRPHPLIKATIESMRPKLWEEYEKLVEEYKEAGWGIYDDTADLNRAIAISDAYFGDSSSLVQLFQKVGKPIMIQNVEVL